MKLKIEKIEEGLDLVTFLKVMRIAINEFKEKYKKNPDYITLDYRDFERYNKLLSGDHPVRDQIPLFNNGIEVYPYLSGIKNMHEHKRCEHKNLKYCEQCDVVWCEDCKKEWKARFEYGTLTYYPYQDGTTSNPMPIVT